MCTCVRVCVHVCGGVCMWWVKIVEKEECKARVASYPGPAQLSIASSAPTHNQTLSTVLSISTSLM